MAFTAMALGWLLSGAVVYVFLCRKPRRSERLLWAALFGAGAGTIMASSLALALAAALLAEISRPRAVVKS